MNQEIYIYIRDILYKSCIIKELCIDSSYNESSVHNMVK